MVSGRRDVNIEFLLGAQSAWFAYTWEKYWLRWTNRSMFGVFARLSPSAPIPPRKSSNIINKTFGFWPLPLTALRHINNNVEIHLNILVRLSQLTSWTKLKEGTEKNFWNSFLEKSITFSSWLFEITWRHLIHSKNKHSRVEECLSIAWLSIVLRNKNKKKESSRCEKHNRRAQKPIKPKRNLMVMRN